MYAESLTIFAKIDLHGETSLRRKKNVNPSAFHFVLHSLCTIFAAKKYIFHTYESKQMVDQCLMCTFVIR